MSSRASRTLYVGDLPGDIREREVEDLFYKYGPIVDIDLKIPPRPPGYSFIEFEDARDADDAIRGRDGYNFDGHRLRVSCLLGFFPVLIAWIYSEILEYKKSSLAKVHSDTNLVGLGNGTIKEDDRAILLEGGLLKSSSAKFPNASVRANLIRFMTMDESFLLENRAVLKAMSEFGITLVYFYICDRTNLFPETSKKYSRGLFLFLYILFIIASALTSLKKHHDKSAFSGKSMLYLNRHQTEEWRGWMQDIKIQILLKQIYLSCMNGILDLVLIAIFGSLE